MLLNEVPSEKTSNHWKLFLQLYIFSAIPFFQNHVLNVLASYFPTFESFRQNKSRSPVVGTINFILDYILTIPLVFLAYTYYSYGIYLTCAGVLILVYALPLLSRPRNLANPLRNPRRTIVVTGPNKFQFVFLHNHISAVFLAMCFGIMFCDTLFFPDILSKTSKGGIGTMDLGAGFILFTSGVTSRQARDINSGFRKRFKESFTLIIICINIGILRMVLSELTKRGDFSHGSHWNIFLIIACIMLLAICIPNILIKYAYFVALAIAVLYQVALSAGLEDFLLDTSRQTNFLEKNAVGLCQTFGLLACYLVGVGFGQKLYNTAVYHSNENEDRTMLMELAKIMAGSGLLFLIAYFAVEQTAPKVCNLAYVAYISLSVTYCAFVSFILERMTVKMGTNIIYDGPAKSSRLIYFIVANILTGAINILCMLEDLPLLVQFAIVVGYTVVLHGVFAVLVGTGVKVRFWQYSLIVICVTIITY
eukprot:TRINITY_DN105463_c0_g1_i1.p1 TRINITY_DN105463_c0_g1~~TRINITY_DN105463_c0_g1_i1.p1  ORF type:complete len:478 (+),score=32.11 TRINITY_DN105463_c0_g1_i1:180-1613(+)